MRIEAGVQQEILKMDRLQQLANGMDAVKGVETIFALHENKPFHTGMYDPDLGYTIFRVVDKTVVTAMKGALLGVYREAVAEDNKGAADRIVEKHR